MDTTEHCMEALNMAGGKLPGCLVIVSRWRVFGSAFGAYPPKLSLPRGHEVKGFAQHRLIRTVATRLYFEGYQMLALRLAK